MGTKNNPKNRAVVEKRKFNGKEVEPILYNGKNIGHGSYMAAKYSGTTELVILQNGKQPAKWDELI